MCNPEDFVIENGILKKYVGQGEDVIVPEGVTEIGASAFERCKELKSVIIPRGVTTIRRRAFSFDDQLSDIKFPDSLKEIQDYALEGCMMLKNLVIPKNVERVSYDALEDTSLARITFYDSFNTGSIGYVVGWRSVCTVLLLSAIDDQPKYEVFMCGGNEPDAIADMLQDAWRPANGKDFDFSQIDSQFNKYKDISDRIYTALLRLKYPFELDAKQEEIYKAFIKRNGYKIISDLICESDTELIRRLLHLDAIHHNHIDSFIEESAQNNRPEITALLMEYKSRNFEKKISDLILSDLPPTLWSVKKDDHTLIHRYNGNETEVFFPAVVDGI